MMTSKRLGSENSTRAPPMDQGSVSIKRIFYFFLKDMGDFFKLRN